MKDNFSQQAALYAQFRPVYPQALYDFIFQQVRDFGLAWDAGTGNGQAASALSKKFESVVATDISMKQLDNASPAPNISYYCEPAEETHLAGNSVHLVTVAQAIHWFNFEKFYEEVRRVSAPGGLLAVWTYDLLKIAPVIDEIINHYHYVRLDGYWDPERKYVDECYRNIPFPFEEIDTPGFTIETNWTLAELEGYLATWSARQKYKAANGTDPVPAVIDEIARHWPPDERKKIVFPLHLRLGRIT